MENWQVVFIVLFLAVSFLINFIVHQKNQSLYESEKRENQTKAAKENGYKKNGEPDNTAATS